MQAKSRVLAPKIMVVLAQIFAKVSLLLQECLRRCAAAPKNYWHLETA
jgi:hypothetical protein